MERKTFNHIKKALKQALCHTQWEKVEDKMGKYNIFEDENFKIKENNMKSSRKLGKKAFYLLFMLIIVFVITELIKPFIILGMSIDGWKLALGTSTALLGIVWGGIASRNFKKDNLE